MSFVLFLVILLVILAGIIAYVGDRLGTLIGRRRLSLFGTRPKRTGQLVGVMAGILIMLTTVGVLALAFRGARDVIFNFQQTLDELNRLRAQERSLGREIDTLQQQIEARSSELEAAQAVIDSAESARAEAEQEAEALRQTRNELSEEIDALSGQLRQLQETAETLQNQNDELSQQNETLFADNDTLFNANALLGEQNDELLNEIRANNTQINALEETVARLEQQVNTQAGVLSTTEQTALAEGGNILYRAGEVIFSQVVAVQEPRTVREALARLVQDANAETFRRGAGEVVLNAEQFTGLVDMIVESPAEDLVILRSPGDQVRAPQVAVTIEAFENRQLVQRGQLLSSRQLHLGSDSLQVQRSEVRRDLSKLLAEATNRLEEMGLFEGALPVLSSVTEEGFTNQLTRLSGPVIVGVIATDTVYTGGPVRLELVILN